MFTPKVCDGGAVCESIVYCTKRTWPNTSRSLKPIRTVTERKRTEGALRRSDLAEAQRLSLRVVRLEGGKRGYTYHPYKDALRPVRKTNSRTCPCEQQCLARETNDRSYISKEVVN